MSKLGRSAPLRRPDAVAVIQDGHPKLAPSPSPGSRALRIGLRAAVGVLVVVLLLVRADVQALADSLSQVRPAYLALAFVVLLAGLVVNAFRWRSFLRPIGLDPPAAELIRLTFVGTFFNAFLPTGFGGDAYKSFRLRGEKGSMMPPLATAILDRLAGLVGLALLAFAGSAVRLATGDQGRVTLAAALLSLGVFAACGLALWLSPRWTGKRETSSRMAVKLHDFANAFATSGREPRAVLWGTVLGTASALLLVIVFGLLAASLGLPVPGAALPGIVLIASLTTIVPLTINGLGLREAAVVWCLVDYGVSSEEALAFSLLVLAVTLASSVVGGVVYVAARTPAPRR